MMRLIDANELYRRYCTLFESETSDAELDRFIYAVASQETVDAIEVVRCRDCQMWARNTGMVDSPNGQYFEHDITTNGHDFCSYGERKISK